MINQREVETLNQNDNYPICKITIEEFRNYASNFKFNENQLYDNTTNKEEGVFLSFELDEDKTIEIQFSEDRLTINYFAYQFKDGAIYLDFIKTIDDLDKWLDNC